MQQIATCEICSQDFIAGYGYSIALNWLVTGHACVRAFMCENHPSGQHWGCTPEHAIQAVEKCLKEHMHSGILKSKHADTGRPRYSESDSNWAPDKGENFHFVNITRG